MTKTYVFRDPGRIANWAVGLSGAQALLSLADIGLWGYYYRLLLNIEYGSPDPEGNLETATSVESVLAGAAIVELVVLLAGLVALLMWVYRVSANVHALGAKDLITTPGLTVGAFFIPLMNIVVPAVALAEIRKASISPSDWSAQKGTALVAVWWLLQLASNVSGYFVGFDTPQDLASLESSAIANIVSQTLTVASLVASILLVRQVTGLQRARWVDREEVAVFA